jgi:hypothetical protein
MKPLFRYLPLALAAFALHAQAQSVSPAYEAFRNKEAPQPAPTQAATPTTQPAAPAPAPAYAAPAPYVAPAPAREAEENGGFFVGLQAGQGWIYEDVEQDAVAASAGYRWQAGPWAQVGVELSGGRLDSTNYRGYDVSKATYKAVGANARMNFGDSPWFATVRGGYFDAEQEYSDSTFSTDGGYAGLAIGVDINRHFNVSLGYTAFVYADDYADEDCDDYDYDCDFNRADTVMLGIEARF